MCTRGHWRPSEDEKLKELVLCYGPHNWNAIAEKLQGRSGAVVTNYSCIFSLSNLIFLIKVYVFNYDLYFSVFCLYLNLKLFSSFQARNTEEILHFQNYIKTMLFQIIVQFWQNVPKNKIVNFKFKREKEGEKRERDRLLSYI
jgi:Myb-like DNA-binding domain